MIGLPIPPGEKSVAPKEKSVAPKEKSVAPKEKSVAPKEKKKVIKKTVSIRGNLSHKMYDMFDRLSIKLKIPKGRLVVIAIDNELVKEHPFEYDLTLPEPDENIDFAYADEGKRIVDFLTTITGGMGLDMLMSLRHEMEIEDRSIFLAAFAECLKYDLIEPFNNIKRARKYNCRRDYVFYRNPRSEAEKTYKRRRNKAYRYQQLVRLKKEFPNG